MNNEHKTDLDKLTDAWQDVNPEYLEEADRLRRHGKKAGSRKRTGILLAVAALFLAVVGTAVVLVIQSHTRNGSSVASGSTAAPESTEASESTAAPESTAVTDSTEAAVAETIPSAAETESEPETTPETTEDQETLRPSEKEPRHQPYRYNGDDPVLSAVLGYVMDRYMEEVFRDSGCSIVVPAVAFLETGEPKDGSLTVYTDIWMWGYFPQGSFLKTAMGGEIPGPTILTLKDSGDGTYEVEDFLSAGYTYENINEVMARYAENPKAEELFKTVQNGAGQSDPVFNGRVAYLREYVQENQLPYDSFTDFGWSPVNFLEDPVNKPEPIFGTQ